MRDPAKKFEDLKVVFLILVHHLSYADVSEPTRLIEEVSKVPEANMLAILNSDS